MSGDSPTKSASTKRRRWRLAIAVLVGALILIGAIPTAIRAWTFRFLKGTTAQHVIAQCGNPHMVAVHASSRWTPAVPAPGAYPWSQINAIDRDHLLKNADVSLSYPIWFGETVFVRVHNGVVERIESRAK